MKLRNGFVSNSSTCSFVIAGWYLKDKIDICRKEWAEKFDLVYEDPHFDNNFWEAMSQIGISCDNGWFIGITLGYYDDQSGSGMNGYNGSLEEVIQDLKEMKEKYGLEGEPRILSDTKGC